MENVTENIEFEKIVFEKVKTSIQSTQCLEDINACGFEYYIDEYSRQMRSRLEVEHYERVADIKEIEITTDRPKFLDWLFKRTPKHILKVELRDILKFSSCTISGTPYIEIIMPIQKETK